MKTTIDMAREANEYADTNWALWPTGNRWKQIRDERFAELVRADQREIDAKVCEELVPDMSRTANDASVWDVATFDCAEAIRNRGNT